MYFDVENEDRRKQRLLANFARIIFFCFLANVLMVTTFVVLGLHDFLFVEPTSIGGAIAGGISLLCSRTLKYVHLGSTLLVASLTAIIVLAAFIIGPSQPVTAAFLAPIILSVFLFSSLLASRLIFVVSIITCISVYFVRYRIPIQIASNNWQTYITVAIWTLIMSVLTALILYLFTKMRSDYRLVVKQNHHLNTALQNLQNNKTAGQEVSRKLYTVTSELQATSSQQAAGSQQQAQEISQISALFTQQVQVAEFIAKYAESIAKTSDGVLEATWRVTNASNATKLQGQLGANATKQTIQANIETRDYFQGLLFTLESVQDINAQIADVNSLIQKFTKDLHVLSLNAAIEAAGSGGQQPRMSKLANEIKKLAERGGSAAETIKSSLSQIELFVSRAVTEIRAGQRVTQAAVDAAQQSGQTMQQLILAISQNEQEALSIQQLALDLHDITDAIKRNSATAYATIQEATKNLQNVSVIVQQNASGSYQLASSAKDIRQLSEHLETVLVSS